MIPRRQGNQREVLSPLQTAEEIAAAKALAATKARADALDYFNTRNDEDKEGLFRLLVLQKSSDKTQSKPIRMNESWPPGYIIQKRYADYSLIHKSVSDVDLKRINPQIERNVRALVDALVRISTSNPNQEDINLINGEKSFLSKNEDFLTEHSLYPKSLID